MERRTVSRVVCLQHYNALLGLLMSVASSFFFIVCWCSPCTKAKDTLPDMHTLHICIHVYMCTSSQSVPRALSSGRTLPVHIRYLPLYSSSENYVMDLQHLYNFLLLCGGLLVWSLFNFHWFFRILILKPDLYELYTCRSVNSSFTSHQPLGEQPLLCIHSLQCSWHRWCHFYWWLWIVLFPRTVWVLLTSDCE